MLSRPFYFEPTSILIEPIEPIELIKPVNNNKPVELVEPINYKLLSLLSQLIVRSLSAAELIASIITKLLNLPRKHNRDKCSNGATEPMELF